MKPRILPAVFSHLLSVWRDVAYIWLAELKRIFRDEAVLIFCVIVPLGYPLLYTFIYNNELVREIPVAAVDQSHTAASRQYLRRLDATPDVRLVAHCSNMAEARRLLNSHACYGIVQVPEDFGRKQGRSEPTVVGAYTDMIGMLFYKGLNIAATDVMLSLSTELKMAARAGATRAEQELAATPVAYDEVRSFNPTMGYASFLIPAVLVLILQQTLLLGIGLGAGTDRERHRFGQLVPIDRHFGGSLRIVAGKALAYLPLYWLLSVYVLRIVPKLFSLPQMGQGEVVCFFALIYLLACVPFALFATAAVRERETAMLLFAFTSILFLFLSGVSWPEYAIKGGWRLISYLIPSTFGIQGFVRINSMGASFAQVLPQVHGLLLQALGYTVLAALVYNRQILAARRKTVAAWLRQKRLSTNNHRPQP